MAASVTESLPSLSPETITTFITSLSLPQPTAVEPLDAAAAFHAIFLVHFAPDSSLFLPGDAAAAGNRDGSQPALVLRVSRRADIPHAKTSNEVAVLRWLARHTSIPVPRVVRFDATADNALGREFTLLERVPGRSVDRMYAGMAEAAKTALVRQLTDVLVELLDAREWHHVGGLRLQGVDRITHHGGGSSSSSSEAAAGGVGGGDDDDDDDGGVVVLPGPVLEDTFWMAPDIEKYWGPGAGESVATLNPTGPYGSHAELVRASLRVYVRAISRHASLAWLRGSLLPRLEALLGGGGSGVVPMQPPPPLLPEAQLAATRLILAHKDLHFANVMATPDGTLTGILDWEFAGVVPANRWDPVRAFLWSGRDDDGEDAAREKDRLRAVFEGLLEERGVGRWWEQGVSEEVEDVWTVLRYTRALVEVCPRGQRAEMVGGWRDAAMDALTRLGVA